MIWHKLVLGVLLALWAAPASAQSFGVLSSTLNVATVGVSNSGTAPLVSAQGSGIKIRVLGFLVTSQNMVTLRLQGSDGTLCTGTMTIATGGSVTHPMSPPGYVCELNANTRLDAVVNTAATGSGGVLSPNVGLLGGYLIWQANQ